MAADRDQLRRHRRPEPQLFGPQPRQPRLDHPQGHDRLPARGGAAGRREDAPQSCARPRPGRAAAPSRVPTAPGSPRSAPDPSRCPHAAAAAFSASAMWAANAATVSPAPDTADGRCHLTVANLRTMPHRSHEWPATLAQLRLAFADDRAFAVHPPVPPTFGDEGAANHMRLGAAHGEPGVEIFVYGVRGGAFPARQHLEASRAIARALAARSRADAVRPAVRGGDRRGRLPQRRGRGRQRACAVRARAGVRGPRRLLRRAEAPAAGSRSSRCRRARSASPTRSDPICSTPSW